MATRKVTALDNRVNGHWAFPEELRCEEAAGFVYAIRMKSSGLLYIGRKNFVSISRKLPKGAKKGDRVRRIVTRTQSNWKTYTSSSVELNALIKEHGKQEFAFYVLEQYNSLGAVGYAETWSLCYAEVPANHDKFLNRNIEKVSWRSNEHISSRHKSRLAKLLELYGNK